MPETEPTLPPERSAEAIVLDLLVGAENQWPWSIEEIARETSDTVDATDAIDALYGAGLIHRTSDGFVFPTRAAVRFRQITL